MNEVVQNTSLEALVGLVADEFLNRQRQGERPDIEEYVARHPEAAEILHNVLASLELVAFSGVGKSRLSGMTSDGGSLGTLGDFRLLREVGRGGMGLVYEAEQISLSRRVALKVLPFAATLDPRQLQRFQNEARAAACLHHPHIVPVFAVGCERSVHFYAMQFIDGQSLDGLLRDLRPKLQSASPAPRASAGPAADALDAQAAATAPGKETAPEVQGKLSTLPEPGQGRNYFRRVAELMAQAAEALEHAHRAGVLHRDIKPGNLLLDGQGKLWVADFGLAQVQSDARLTRTGDLVGTLRYMSPEQALAKRVVVDHRTDIYSLGATLYELLTLQPAFSGKDRQELLRQIAFEEPPRARHLNRAIPAELETITTKALEKNAEDRYDSALDLADDLKRFLRDEPILARRPSLAHRARKWTMRHQTVVLATTAALLVGMVISTWQAVRAMQAENNAVSESSAKDAALQLALTNEAKAKDAAEAESKAKTLAEKRLGQLEKANDILASLFQDLDPRLETKGGPSLKEQLVKRLDQITLQLENEATGDPLTTARLQQILGQTRNSLGDARQALELTTKAHSIFAATLGPDHALTLKSTLDVANALRDSGQLLKALPHLEATFLKQRELLGLKHPDVLATMGDLGSLYHALGKYDRSIPLLEESLRLRKAHFGPDHHSTLASQNNLAVAYGDIEIGRPKRAVPLLEKTLIQMQTLHGPDHVDVLSVREALAGAYWQAGQGQKALSLAEETLQKRKVKLGPHHPATLGSMRLLALQYLNAGQRDAALPLLEMTLEKSDSLLGPDHPDTLDTMSQLAQAYYKAGQRLKALPLLEKVLERQKAVLGVEHLRTLETLLEMGRAYKDAGQDDQALRVLELAVEKHKAMLGTDHMNTLICMDLLARTYRATGQFDRAIPLHEETVAKSTERFGADHLDTLTSMNNLAKAYLAAGKKDKALAMYEYVWKRRVAVLGSDHAESVQSLYELVSAYNTTRQYAKAEPFYREALQRIIASAGAKSVRTANAQAGLALNLLRQQKFADAEPVLRECLAFRAAEQPNVWTTFSTQAYLGDSLLGQKKHADAEPLLLEGLRGMKEREKTIPVQSRPRLLEALVSLVQLYDAWGKQDQADEWRKQLQTARAAKPAPKLEK